MSAHDFRLAFVEESTRGSRWGIAILAVGAAALALAAVHLLDTRSQAQSLQDRIQGQMPTAPVHMAARLNRDELRSLNDQIRAVNGLVENLNVAWDDVFRALRVPAGMDVVLIGLETTGRTGVLRLHGEAARFDAMTDYVDLLAQKPAFAGAQLVKHEVARDSPGAPYRFTVEVTWKP
jgi:Tfp pilus assembly protein PilN